MTSTDGKASAPPKGADLSKDATAEPTKIDPIKAEAGKSDLNRNESSKPDATKDTPKTATFPSGAPGAARPAGPAADGPIIDLKAKRLPDPAPAQKTSATGAGIMPGVATKPADAGVGESAKPVDTKSADTKPGDPKTPSGGSADNAARPANGAGTTTPKITPVAPSARGPGFGSVATAGLLGGVIGAGLLFAVERAGVLPQADDGRLAALDQRIAALAPKDEVARLSQRVASNETALKAVPEAVSTAREALQKASAAPAPSADGAAPQTAPALPPDLAARLDSLDQRVSALQEEPGQQGGEARMAVTPANGDAAQVAALAERLKAVETQVAAAPKPSEQPDLTPKLAALQTALDDRAKANAEATQTLGQKLTEVQQALDAKVQAATQASQQAAESGKTQAAEAAKGIERQVQTQLQAQSDKIAGLDKALSERAEVATVQAALRVVSADRIVTALNTGTPYADALAALRTYEPGDPARLTAVAVFADRGAPTARTLAAEFRTVAEKIAAGRRAAQVRSVAETGDFGQKLMSMAESIVQVRKVETPAPSAQGAAPATDPLPKVQDALDRGAIAEAAQVFIALPEDIRVQAGEFGTKLKSRAAAGEAAQALLSDAFKGLPVTAASR
ncbi:COG4223 family protein [Methylobacterium sp. J-090]|uniref:COG4223 family protein n=1 Tax=Methylobacterium sp. J-090 TaxID=2836666 RepID=UPI001FB94DAF|nr:hypothetical protein [Methylobacterium sp. J-090]MCJ2083050.1 hypothetical protein [Methylobacterium sp. J-090]